MNRSFYSSSIKLFLNTSNEQILGELSIKNEFPLESTQRDAWLEEISILKKSLKDYEGNIYLEFSIPRMGQRIDAVILINSAIFVIEFKIGEKKFNSAALDQVMDYALDLKNFHETSHNQYIAPILVATKSSVKDNYNQFNQNEMINYLILLKYNSELIYDTIKDVLELCEENIIINEKWESGKYKPTPTIIEAATILYKKHSVKSISRSDADAINLSYTSDFISNIIKFSKKNNRKSICFVTGVPGAGKTLVGLNIATKHIDKLNELYSVFLSGNGPLVSILREALTRDKVKNEKLKGNKIKKSQALSEIKIFIQNVHNFRDECLIDIESPPIEHVALFDEAQRAWDKNQTSNFMLRRKRIRILISPSLNFLYPAWIGTKIGLLLFV